MTIEEIRKNKIFGLAIFDLVLGMLGLVMVFILTRQLFFPKLPIQNFIFAAILLTIPLGIVSHVIFGIDTTLNYRLGLSNKP